MGVKFTPTDYREKKLRDMGITPPDWADDEQVRAAKLAEMGYQCEQAIYAGVYVVTSQGTKHFCLQAHDQTELMAQKAEMDKALAGMPSLIDPKVGVPYHADGELCRYWSIDDFSLFAKTAIAHIFYHRSYCNCLNAWIRRAAREEFETLNYGAALPDDLAEHLAALLEGK